MPDGTYIAVSELGGARHLRGPMRQRVVSDTMHDTGSCGRRTRPCNADECD